MLDKVRKRLQDEFNRLNHELIHELPKEIDTARALGDLRENAEYKAALERQEYVRGRMAALQKRLADLSLVNLNRIPKDRAAYGSRIELVDLQSNTNMTVTLVTQEEANVEEGYYSLSSPLGKALLNRQEGEEVQATTPSGVRRFEIVTLVTIHNLDE